MKKIVIFIVLIFFITGCIRRTAKKNEILSSYSDLNLKTIELNKSSAEELLIKINKAINKIKSMKKKSTSVEIENFVLELNEIKEELNAVQLNEKICDYDKGEFVIPPMTQVIMQLDSYCLNSLKAIPDKDETFVFTKESPDIPVFYELMKYTNTVEATDKKFKQKLLWHLANDVKFENLSFEESAILLKADPSSIIKVNSGMREAAGNYLKRIIPGLKEADRAYKIIKGKVHTYEEYESVLTALVSKEKPVEVQGPVKSDGYELYTETETKGYKAVKIKMINTGLEPVRAYGYLRPLRADVQPIALDLPKSPEDSMKDAITKQWNQLAADSILYIFDDKINEGDKKTIIDNPDKLVDIWRAYGDNIKAKEYTEKFCRDYPELCSDSRHNCTADAFRHAIWNAFMARDVGDFALEISNNHEMISDQHEMEREMDLYNNKIGWDAGISLKERGFLDDSLYYEELLKLDRKSVV